MTKAARAPFAEVDTLLIDGNNLLHRMTGGVEVVGINNLVAQLRQVLPARLRTVLVLDGHATDTDPISQRARTALDIRHSGSQSADDMLVGLTSAEPFERRARLLVVTSDRALTDRIRHAGGRTQRLEWLEGLLSRPAGAASPTGSQRRSVGLGRPRVAMPRANDEHEREPWQPGRGATRKTGNPRRTGRRG